MFTSYQNELIFSELLRDYLYTRNLFYKFKLKGSLIIQTYIVLGKRW